MELHASFVPRGFLGGGDFPTAFFFLRRRRRGFAATRLLLRARVRVDRRLLRRRVAHASRVVRRERRAFRRLDHRVVVRLPRLGFEFELRAASREFCLRRRLRLRLGGEHRRLAFARLRLGRRAKARFLRARGFLRRLGLLRLAFTEIFSALSRVGSFRLGLLLPGALRLRRAALLGEKSILLAKRLLRLRRRRRLL